MKEYNMIGRDIGIIVSARSAVEAMEKDEASQIKVEFHSKGRCKYGNENYF